MHARTLGHQLVASREYGRRSCHPTPDILSSSSDSASSHCLARAWPKRHFTSFSLERGVGGGLCVLFSTNPNTTSARPRRLFPFTALGWPQLASSPPACLVCFSALPDACARASRHTHTHTHTQHAHMHTYPYRHTHSHTYTHSHSRTHARIHTRTHSFTHQHTPACPHT